MDSKVSVEFPFTEITEGKFLPLAVHYSVVLTSKYVHILPRFLVALDFHCFFKGATQRRQLLLYNFHIKYWWTSAMQHFIVFSIFLLCCVCFSDVCFAHIACCDVEHFTTVGTCPCLLIMVSWWAPIAVDGAGTVRLLRWWVKLLLIRGVQNGGDVRTHYPLLRVTHRGGDWEVPRDGWIRLGLYRVDIFLPQHIRSRSISETLK